MKRAALLLIGSLLLAACTPRVAPSGATLTPDPFGASLTITPKTAGGATYQVVRLYAGADALTPKVKLFAQAGAAVSVNSTFCQPSGANAVCDLPKLSKGDAYLIPARNVAAAEAEFLRSDGKTYFVKTQ